MKFYEITITPESPFGTPLKGDTLFGHFCWQAAYDPGLLDGGLESQLANYGEKPFAVFSSAFPKISGNNGRYFFPRPDAMLLDRNLLTATSRKKRLLDGKALKKKKWMAIERLDIIDPGGLEFLSGEEVASRVYKDRPANSLDLSIMANMADVTSIIEQPHNTIDRLTGTTGTGLFAPYAKKNHHYPPGATLAIFLLIDETCTDINRVCSGLERIGRWGFGRDASTGMGRFSVAGNYEIPMPSLDRANACYTLGPTVPQRDCFQRAFFTPFVRFGKHGDRLAVGKSPFKRPVLMADEGAVFIPADPKGCTTPWLGTGVSAVSYSEPKAVVQGYAPWLPLKMEL